QDREDVTHPAEYAQAQRRREVMRASAKAGEDQRGERGHQIVDRDHAQGLRALRLAETEQLGKRGIAQRPQEDEEHRSSRLAPRVSLPCVPAVWARDVEY